LRFEKFLNIFLRELRKGGAIGGLVQEDGYKHNPIEPKHINKILTPDSLLIGVVPYLLRPP
tara:strand:+ start:892 stop:1074 length:183 start_codon:yes stop_codon:yes gene_type:complete